MTLFWACCQVAFVVYLFQRALRRALRVDRYGKRNPGIDPSLEREMALTEKQIRRAYE